MKIGVRITSSAGATISFKEALVDIEIQALKSGSAVPFLIPGFSRNYLLISSTLHILNIYHF